LIETALLKAFSFVQHPILKVMLTIAVSLLGFGLCKSYRYYVKNQREALIQPPVDLSGDNDSQENSQETTGDPAPKSETKDPQRRFSKAQARHRFKKGKAN